MSTGVQLHVYAVPAEQIAAVVDVIEEYGLSSSYGDFTSAQKPQIRLGGNYGKRDTRGTCAGEIAAELIANAPAAVFHAWDDPAEDYLGSGVIYAPGLGLFEFDSNAQGQPVFTAREVQDALRFDNLDTLLGTAHATALDEAVKALSLIREKDRLVVAPACPGCGTPGACERYCAVKDPLCQLRDCEDHTACAAAAAAEDQAHAMNEGLTMALELFAGAA